MPHPVLFRLAVIVSIVPGLGCQAAEDVHARAGEGEAGGEGEGEAGGEGEGEAGEGEGEAGEGEGEAGEGEGVCPAAHACASATSRLRCVVGDGGVTYVEAPCGAGEGCVAGRCVVGACSDSCVGGGDCDMADVAGAAPTTSGSALLAAPACWPPSPRPPATTASETGPTGTAPTPTATATSPTTAPATTTWAIPAATCTSAR